MNKYCGQHFIIANEIQETEPTPPRTRSTLQHQYEDDENDEVKGEPVAEALIHNDQQFHHLKIMKSSVERPEQIPYEPIKPTKQKNKNRRIYSQVSELRIRSVTSEQAKTKYLLKKFRNQ